MLEHPTIWSDLGTRAREIHLCHAHWPMLPLQSHLITCGEIVAYPHEVSMKLTLASIFGLSFGLLSMANAVSYSSLEERMSQSEMHAAGLDKLSAAELKSLNGWLQLHSVGSLSKVHHAEEVFYPEESDKVKVDDQIDGKFIGWRGQTIFKLKNGQEWQQAESGSGCTSYSITDPKVIIKPMLLGSWLMYVGNTDCNLRVKRLK